MQTAKIKKLQFIAFHFGFCGNQVRRRRFNETLVTTQLALFLFLNWLCFSQSVIPLQLSLSVDFLQTLMIDPLPKSQLLSLSLSLQILFIWNMDLWFYTSLRWNSYQFNDSWRIRPIQLAMMSDDWWRWRSRWLRWRWLWWLMKMNFFSWSRWKWRSATIWYNRGGERERMR